MDINTQGSFVRKFHEFGTLMKTCENIDLQMLNSEKNVWRSVDLMFFDLNIVVIQTDRYKNPILLDAEETFS